MCNERNQAIFFTEYEHLLFRGNYDECLGILQQLENLKGKDCKIHHNQMVAKFYKGKCKDYMDLLKSLKELNSSEVCKDH